MALLLLVTALGGLFADPAAAAAGVDSHQPADGVVPVAECAHSGEDGSSGDDKEPGPAPGNKCAVACASTLPHACAVPEPTAAPRGQVFAARVNRLSAIVPEEADPPPRSE